MKVLIVEPGKYPREADIEHTLEAEQAVVGGTIEAVYPWRDSACIVCNDNGIAENLPLNRMLGDYDIIHGTFFVCGLTRDDFTDAMAEMTLCGDAADKYRLSLGGVSSSGKEPLALGALPRKPRRSSYAVRQDAYKLDQRIQQMEFLSRNSIDTLTQLETYRQAKLGEIVQLTAERKSLYKANPDSSRIQQITAALKQLRQEERLCRKIAEHSIEVQQHLTEARRDRAEQQKQEQEGARDRRPNIDLTL